MRYQQDTATWTDDRIALLKKLWADGLSAGRISEELGGGVSRSAVLGKVHRLKLAKRGRDTGNKQRKPRSIQGSAIDRAAVARMRRAAQGDRPKPGARPADAINPAPSIIPKVNAGELAELYPVETRKTFAQLNGHDCRWPVGDPGDADFFFCGRPTGEGDHYCATHRSIAGGQRTPGKVFKPLADRKVARFPVFVR